MTDFTLGFLLATGIWLFAFSFVLDRFLKILDAKDKRIRMLELGARDG